MLFNYEKMRNLIYSMDQYGKINTYPVDSVSSFEIVENSVIYSFEKIPWISTGYYLMPIIKSEKGYSFYKKLLCKFIGSTYNSAGYYSEESKYDAYADYYEYYLVYPGNKSYKKILLKEKTVRRALKDEESLIDDYFKINEPDFNEQSVLGIIQYINDKKYPE
jgi:hypothetical protein